MVTRKPVPATAHRGLAPDSNPPYPTTPVSTNSPPSFRMQNVHDELQSETDSEASSANAWGRAETQNDNELQQPASEQSGTSPGIPESLRVGPPGYTPKTSQENLSRPSAATTNPYLQRQQSAQKEADDRKEGATAWGGFAARPPLPSSVPPPPPIPQGT